MKHMKCALIAVARDEDKYIDEWIKYHLNLGIDHIYICDNNDPDKPLVYNNNKVTVIPVNDMDFTALGFGQSQQICYNKMLDIIWDKYDYCAMCDIDEFFNFKNCNTVQEFIQKYLIDTGCNVAEIAWEVYDDNDLIFHIDKPVRELYTRVQNKMPFIWVKNECSWGKPIFKLCDGIKIGIQPHWPDTRSMDSIGGFKTTHIKKCDAVVDHYRTKCLEDYMKHKFACCNASIAPFTGGGNIIRSYFDFNPITLDKLMWVLKFAKECNYKISDNDRHWIIDAFSNGFSPITVVVRTHNRLKQLKECLKCIRNQYHSCKILVLNDGSTDGTSEWLATQDLDYLSLRTNVGPGEVLSRGKHLITTPYYIILDDDDVWSKFGVIDFFYNILIDYPQADFIDTGYALHTGHLVSTKLLIDCPNLSLWARDDWYFDWIKSHANHTCKCNVDFYGYTKYNESDDEYKNSWTDYYDNTLGVSKEFYNGNKSCLRHIPHQYHIGGLRERKVFDQIKSYYETGKIYNV